MFQLIDPLLMFSAEREKNTNGLKFDFKMDPQLWLFSGLNRFNQNKKF